MIGFALVVGFAFGIVPAFATTACLLLPALLLDFVMAGLLTEELLEAGALALLVAVFDLTGAVLLAALAALGRCGAFAGFFVTGLAAGAAGFAAFFTGRLPVPVLVADFATTFFFAVTVLLPAFVAGCLRLAETAGFLLAGAVAFLRTVPVVFFAGALTDLAGVAVLLCLAAGDLPVVFPEEVVLPEGAAVFFAVAAAFPGAGLAGLLAAFFGAGVFFFLEAIRSNSLNISLTHW